MGIRTSAAQALSTVSAAALKHVFRRPAGNFPGKLALYVDPAIIENMAKKLRRGSVCVVGTNGKTTVTNMLADCLVAAGQQVVCNRTGANLDSGVATSLLNARQADWGIFECDELWLAKILPYLKSRYVVLLNLFHDQVDRIGAIDNIQKSIIAALGASPNTVLLYNADDPHCEKIARSVSNQSVPFGVGEGLDALEGSSVETQICQCCEHLLEYRYRTYSQLGSYACPACDFARSHLMFIAQNCQVGLDGMNFDVVAAVDQKAVAGGLVAHLEAPYSGTYMLYNLLAVYAAAHLLGLSNNVAQLTVKNFNQHNGRLEQMNIHGREVLLNLAKNPTGFNQNLGLVLQETGPVAVGFFVNDMEGDGRDVSWLWDIDFESLTKCEDIVVYAGGMRAKDLVLRLKYAGVCAMEVENATELIHCVFTLDPSYKVFIIANYTSLPIVRDECVKLAEGQVAPIPTQAHTRKPKTHVAAAPEGKPVRIVHLFPDLLDQGGDAGNVVVLAQRCAWRGIPVEIEQVFYGEQADFSQADIVVLGDGFDRQQRIACEQLLPIKAELKKYVEDNGVLLAVDGGLQILGHTWYIDDEELKGLGILDMSNGRAKGKHGRIVGDIAVQTGLCIKPVIGFENHEGITQLGDGLVPFGTVLKGVGNNEDDKTEGVRYKNLLGTYVHGPLLGKNPELADWLICQARKNQQGGDSLADLDDVEELAAHAFMQERLGI